MVTFSRCYILITLILINPQFQNAKLVIQYCVHSIMILNENIKMKVTFISKYLLVKKQLTEQKDL